MNPVPATHRWQQRLHEVIYEADTPAGKVFDLGLIASIAISVLAVMLESVASIREAYGPWLRTLEWVFTVAFSVEYVLRIITVKRPLRYVFSFYGLVDVLAILPTYVSLLFPGLHYLMIIRGLRILRVFRVLKLVLYLREGEVLANALRSSRRKITMFLFAVVVLVMIVGSLMYLIEGGKNGFTSIPVSIYWAIVTLTTVGYGDIAPQTVLGKTFAAFVMIMGYAIIAVPTGIVTAELARGATQKEVSTQACPSCSREGHDADARYCNHCGHAL